MTNFFVVVVVVIVVNNARKNLPADKLAVAERIKIFLNSPSETSRFWIRPRSCHRNNLVTEKLCLLCCGHPCCGDFAHSEFAPSTVTIPGMTHGVSHLLLPRTSHLTSIPSTRDIPPNRCPIHPGYAPR